MNKNIKSADLRNFFHAVLKKEGIRSDVADYLIEGIIQASLRGIDSHGIRLFPHYLEGFKGGRLNKSPNYKYTKTSSGTGKLDADHAPGHAAGMEGMKKAIELAKDNGIGAVAVNNSSHFGAAAYYAFEAARNDMIGLSFTHATAHVPPYGGQKPFLGNNPICLVAPCEGEDPFCLDMATTTVTFNKIQQHKEEGKQIPTGWGADVNGRETLNPKDAVNLLPIGGYKGFGLSMMVEILCGLLTGAPYGPAITHMYGTPMDQKRLLGHFFLAVRIDCFEDLNVFKKRLKSMMDELRNTPGTVMAPGDPEKIAEKTRLTEGIPVPKVLINTYKNIAKNYQIEIAFD